MRESSMFQQAGIPAPSSPGPTSSGPTSKLPTPSIPWMAFTLVVLLATLAGIAVFDPSITGGAEPKDASTGTTFLIFGAGLMVAGVGMVKMLEPMAAETRQLVEHSVVVPGEVVELSGGQLLGVSKPVVRFAGVDGAPQTRQLLAAGRFAVGQQVLVRHDPSNDCWLVPDGPDPAAVAALTKAARAMWLIPAMGVVLFSFAAFGLI